MEQQIRETDEEINLYDLWKVIVKRKKIISFFFLIIVISMTTINFLLPKIYRGEVSLSIVDGSVSLNSGDTILKRTETANEITDLLGRIDGENKILIFPKTYISVKTLKLKAFKNSTNKISVTIEANNPKKIPVAAMELVYYLNNMESVKANINEEKEILTQKSIEMSKLLESATNLTAQYDKRLAEGKLLDVGFNPIDLRKKIVDIKIEKLEVDQSVTRLKNGRIQMMTQPIISPEPVSPKMARNVILGSILGLFLVVFLAFFIENIKRQKSN